MFSETYSRRTFILHLSTLTTVGLTLIGCRNEDSDESPCEIANDLPDQALRARDALEYVNNSPFEQRYCSNCMFWVPPANDYCGGCQLLAGPIDPEGYCTSWAPPVVS